MLRNLINTEISSKIIKAEGLRFLINFGNRRTLMASFCCFRSCFIDWYSEFLMVASDRFKTQNRVKMNIVTLEIHFKCILLRHIQNPVPINFVLPSLLILRKFYIILKCLCCRYWAYFHLLGNITMRNVRLKTGSK